MHKQFGTEEGLYFKRILFPPPPFIGDPTIPAHENFRLRLVFEEVYGWEVEVVAKDDTLCWTDGPLSQEQAKDKRLSIQARLTGLSTKEFARFCDLNLVAIDEGIDFEDN